jgi:DNA-binding LacI/PurR family transcriptional regulator
VSYVLNETPNTRISPATRERILATAGRLSYIPHAAGRSLRLGRSNLVLVLTSDFTFGYSRDQMIAALDRAMSARGYALLVHRYTEASAKDADVWRLVAPDAVVSIGIPSPATLRSIRDARIPLVIVERLLDNREVGKMQVTYLFGKGHRRLGYAYPVNQNVASIAENRLEGARAACRQLCIRPPVVERVNLEDASTVTAALNRWAALRAAPTAICAHNDQIAVMISLALSSRGLMVGRDLAVIGVDDIPASGLGISTIKIDIQMVSQEIAERTVAALEGTDAWVQGESPLRVVARASA